ncbi:hypothetical protein N7474_001592 [Penicillium riverlandense]|uniref:uncharacterized protein n=1 Tax=Penicillium riverlandense TaxID=1903569 RepID=UPI002549698C|nr:uncharacterized protein N7474_001592 [Penicillium riverlandense]KAJ5833281.1 hypothetical protein N7474_001592 [Penicillium riverlandense]
MADEQTPLLDVEAHTPRQKSVSAVIGVLLIGVFIANAEGSLVLATNSQIASDLGRLEDASWLVTSYILAMTAAQPLYGKLSDIFGRSSLLIVGYSFFSLGCLICGLAPSLPIAILGRAISGIGGAGMGSLVSICITDLVPKRDIAPWRSYVNVVATVSRSLGGPVGGYLADTVGWRWTFLGQCPPTLLAIILTARLVPSTSTNKDADSTEYSTALARFSRIDWAGALCMVVAIVSLLLPLEMAGPRLPWTHPFILGCLVLSAVTIYLFVVVELRWATEPIFPLRVLRSRTIVLAYLITFFQTSAQLGMMYSVPLFFQLVDNASASVAGAHLFPAIAGVAVAGLIGGHAIRRGLGNGLVQAAGFIALTSSISTADMAVASSAYYLSSNIGTVFGMAATNAIFQTTLREDLEQRLAGYEAREKIIDAVLSNIDYIRRLTGPLRKTIVKACVKGLEYGHMLQLGLAVAAFICVLFLREQKLEDEESEEGEDL